MRDTWRPDIEEVLEHYGSRITGSGKWRKMTCPLLSHDDQSPSASVNTETGKWQCFSCDVHGDALDIIQANEETCAGFTDALRFAKSNFAGGDSGLRDEPVSRTGLSGGSRSGRRKPGPFVPPWGRL